jgi:hypothetical protein
MLSVPNIKTSEYNLEQFIARGFSEGFIWWISSYSEQ